MKPGFEIEAVNDLNGQPVYIIKQDGVDRTSRWARADADRELERVRAETTSLPGLSLIAVCETGHEFSRLAPMPAAVGTGTERTGGEGDECFPAHDQGSS